MIEEIARWIKTILAGLKEDAQELWYVLQMLVDLVVERFSYEGDRNTLDEMLLAGEW